MTTIHPTQLCKCGHEQQQHNEEHGCMCGTLGFMSACMTFCQCAKFTASTKIR